MKRPEGKLDLKDRVAFYEWMLDRLAEMAAEKLSEWNQRERKMKKDEKKISGGT